LLPLLLLGCAGCGAAFRLPLPLLLETGSHDKLPISLCKIQQRPAMALAMAASLSASKAV
jgi:hypothetical protein